MGERGLRPTEARALAEAARSGDRRALARVLTLVENGHPGSHEALAALFPYSGHAQIVGITGSPGAGKSTLVNRLARELRSRAQKVAIVAVDPSSPFTGGAFLGDRLRMRDLVDDPGIFIRSMASRGHAGGVAHATRDLVTVLDAVGIPVILVETVGAGQAQVEVAQLVHTVVLVEAPGMGDDIQAIKAGLMEIATIIVVNKADRPEAQQTLRILQSAQMGGGPAGKAGESSWQVPVLQASAIDGTGVGELIDAISAHRRHLEVTGQWEAIRLEHVRSEVSAWLQRHIQALVARTVSPEQVEAAVARVLRREQDPASAAGELVQRLIQALSDTPAEAAELFAGRESPF